MSDLKTAVETYARLAMEYHALVAFNYHREDLTGLIDKRGIAIAIQRISLYQWVLVNDPAYLIAVPLPEKAEEIEQAALEQHRLHVRLFEAGERVKALSTVTSTDSSAP